MEVLSDAKIRKIKHKPSPYYLTDGRGLFLYVSNAGTKLWRFRYQRAYKERNITIGEYPSMTLEQARTRREALRAILMSGRDPIEVEQEEKAARKAETEDTFEVIAREWHALNKPGWSSNHATDVLSSLEKHIFPALGDKPVKSITAPMVMTELRKIEERPAVETARRVRQRMSAVFVFAIATGRGTDDPAAIVRPAMAPVKRGKFPAVRTIAEARDVLARTEGIPAHPATKLALRFLALTVVRPGTLIETPWTEFDNLDPKDPIWTVPAARMKLRVQHKDDEERDHHVPLPRAALEVLEALRPLTGRSPYVFPNARFYHRPMSENALGYLLNRAGFYQRHVPHGWRSTFSTVMNELRPRDSRFIDMMLAHVPKDKVEAAYNRAMYVKLRRKLSDQWAALLLKDAAPARDLLTGRRK